MVTGIESFKEWFKGNESQYAIIGGTACDILMTEEGLMLNSWGLWDERKNRFFRK